MTTREKYTLLLLILIWPALLAILQVSGGVGAGSINQSNLANGAVGTAQLKTSTGSASASVAYDATMNDYAFFSSNTCNGSFEIIRTHNVADPSNTVGRLHQDDAGLSPCVTRWRYVTASDNPSMWVVYNALGVIVATWTSDDPCELTDTIPCVSVSPCIGCTTKKFKSSDFAGYTFPPSVVTAATNFIQANKYNMANLPYRALQAYANDQAPSGWIKSNLKIVAGLPVLASTGLTVLP